MCESKIEDQAAPGRRPPSLAANVRPFAQRAEQRDEERRRAAGRWPADRSRPGLQVIGIIFDQCAELLAVGRQLSNITFLAAGVYVEAVEHYKRNVPHYRGPSCSRR